jgi:hypothetical protein
VSNEDLFAAAINASIQALANCPEDTKAATRALKAYAKSKGYTDEEASEELREHRARYVDLYAKAKLEELARYCLNNDLSDSAIDQEATRIAIIYMKLAHISPREASLRLANRMGQLRKE